VLGGLTAALALGRLGEARSVGLALVLDATAALALTQANLPVVRPPTCSSTPPQTASIALGAVLIDLVDYRILLLVIARVLLACGGVLGIRPRQAPDDRAATLAGPST
jgi:hypothetical protein